MVSLFNGAFFPHRSQPNTPKCSSCSGDTIDMDLGCIKTFVVGANYYIDQAYLKLDRID